VPDPGSRPPRLAIVFGSSFLGFATHFGFLRELLVGGRRPVAVAGSSAGAIVAGLYAAGLSIEQMEAAFTRRDMCAHFREWRIPFRALGPCSAGAGCRRCSKGYTCGACFTSSSAKGVSKTARRRGCTLR
jgi:predicted acylesterase/phospholipase RssA